MFEVGFANLAFGLTGFLPALAEWETHAQVVVLLGYALYLFQAACLTDTGILRTRKSLLPDSGAVSSPRSLCGDDGFLRY